MGGAEGTRGEDEAKGEEREREEVRRKKTRRGGSEE